MSPEMLSLEDESAIKKLVFRYALAVSRADGDSLETIWAEGCSLELVAVTGQELRIEGRDAVVEYQREHMGWYEALVQLVGEGYLWSGPDGVEGRWIVWEVGRRSGSASDRMGVVHYADRYVCETGEWLFSTRRLSVHYDMTELPAGKYAPLPGLP
jgi:hypothetical protein